MKDEGWVLDRRMELLRQRDDTVLQQQEEGSDEWGSQSERERYWDLQGEIDGFDDQIALLEEILELGKEVGT